MRFEHNGVVFELLGDPHLGKRFRNGVPLHRLGDREKTQWADFRSSLFTTGCQVHVCMGDIFDGFIVPLTVILKTATIYREAALASPNVVFVLLRGNHDASRDLERTSAFDILAALLADVSNIRVVKDEVFNAAGGQSYVPWHPVHNASEIAVQVSDNCTIAFGHWDVVTVSDKSNEVPVAVLKSKGVEVIITGHDHLQSEIEIDGVRVIRTGSMQPYSHSEDPKGERYVTLTPDEVRERTDLADKCVRVRLKPDEIFDDVIECLSFSKVRDKADEDEDVAVEFEEFDFNSLLTDAFAEAGVSADFQAKTRTKVEDVRFRSG